MSKTGFYSKQMQASYPPDLTTHLLVTKSLLKFCYEHNYKNNQWIEMIENCANKLETGEGIGAVRCYSTVPLGKEGFNEWYPTPVYNNETEEYVKVMFDALVGLWSNLMKGLSTRYNIKQA